MFKILSLDGGGVRGILTAAVMERLFDGYPDFSKADLIAGTSIGGILALGLAAGKTPSELKILLYQECEKIFDDSWLHDLRELDGLAGASYDNTALKSILQQIFGKLTLGELSKKVVIPSFNLDNKDAKLRSWEPKFHHNFENSSDNNLLVSEVALRTSAAPTYFPSFGTFIDGGVIANDPSLAATLLTQDAAVNIFPRPALNEIAVMSIGTGKSLTYIEGQDHDWGDVRWVQPLIQLLLDANMGVVEGQCSQLLKDRFCRIAPIFNNNISIPLDSWRRRDDLLSIAKQIDLGYTLTWLRKYWI